MFYHRLGRLEIVGIVGKIAQSKEYSVQRRELQGRSVITSVGSQRLVDKCTPTETDVGIEPGRSEVLFIHTTEHDIPSSWYCKILSLIGDWDWAKLGYDQDQYQDPPR